MFACTARGRARAEADAIIGAAAGSCGERSVSCLEMDILVKHPPTTQPKHHTFTSRHAFIDNERINENDVLK